MRKKHFSTNYYKVNLFNIHKKLKLSENTVNSYHVSSHKLDHSSKFTAFIYIKSD